MNEAVQIGKPPESTGVGFTLIGRGCKIEGDYSIAIGNDISIKGNRSVGIGNGFEIEGDDRIVIAGVDITDGIEDPEALRKAIRHWMESMHTSRVVMEGEE